MLALVYETETLEIGVVYGRVTDGIFPVYPRAVSADLHKRIQFIRIVARSLDVGVTTANGDG